MISAAKSRRASAAGSAAHARCVVLVGARRLEGHELDEPGRVPALRQIVRGHAEAPQVLLREVDAPDARVHLDVAQDVGDLERDAQVHRVLARPRVRVAEDLDAAEPHRGGHAIAVGIERVEGLVGGMVHVHLHPRDDLLERGARDREAADRHLQPLAGRMLGPPLVDARDLLAPAPELQALLLAVRHLVHRVVHDAAEGVARVDGLALGPRQAEERVEEVRATLAGEARDELVRVHAFASSCRSHPSSSSSSSYAGAQKWPPHSPSSVGAFAFRSVPQVMPHSARFRLAFA